MMRDAERSGRLDRAIEYLPNDEEVAERANAGRGLTRPEISVLLAYAKMELYDELLGSDFPDDPLLVEDLKRYFPAPLIETYEEAILRHRLRREIIATYVTNSLVNRAGPTFVNEMRRATGRSVPDIARAYTVVRDAFDLRSIWEGIEALDNKVPAGQQTTMRRETQSLIERCTSWLLRNGPEPLEVSATMAAYGPGIGKLAGNLAKVQTRSGVTARKWERNTLMKQGVPEPLAKRIASLDVVAAGFDIVHIAQLAKLPVDQAGRVYFALGERFELDWLRATAKPAATASQWQKMAMHALVDDFYAHQSELTMHVLKAADGKAAKGASDKLIDGWAESRAGAVERTRQLLGDIKGAASVDLAMLAVANRQLRAMLAG
jgi:glutamate dehydrogenase